MPAVAVAFALAIVTLPILIFLKFTANALAGLDKHASTSFTGLFLMALIPDLLIVVIAVAVCWSAYLTCEITLTNRRLVFRSGLLSRRSGELPLENIESVFISEPLFGRLLGYGTVTVTTVGGQTMPFQFIRTPRRFYALLKEAANATKTLGPSATKVATSAPNDDSRYMPQG